MAKVKSIRLIVITPERQILDQSVDGAVIPAHDGEIGIEYDRAPLMCELGIGRLHYRLAGKTHGLFVDGGFAQVLSNTVVVLTSAAALPNEITQERIAELERTADRATDTSLAAYDERQRARRRAAVLRSVKAG
jgi:F-type H+-transporting ATPase subunit epsilon